MKENIKKEIRKSFEESNIPEVEFIESISKLKVDLIGYTYPNPYKIICEVAAYTWGDYDNLTKWNKLSPEARFEIVKGSLDKRALPLAPEHLKVNFLISGISRAGFDQIARARIGVNYGTKGFKDNCLRHIGFMIPSRLLDNEELIEEIKEHIIQANRLYAKIQNSGVPNWSARCVIPMYSIYRFIMSFDFLSLQQFCSNRMNFTEMEDVVGTAWLMRERIKEKFPLLGEYLRPAEDWARKDLSAQVNGFAEEVGVPHAPSGRWHVDKQEFEKKYGKPYFNEPCTNINILEKYLKIKIPSGTDWKNYTWETLEESDKKLFEED